MRIVHISRPLALVPLAALACAPPPAEPEVEPAPRALAVTEAVNELCPRSGKPITADSLTTYRGRTVGFCNTHCRDDFAADPEASPEDRDFFDERIAARGGGDSTSDS